MPEAEIQLLTDVKNSDKNAFHKLFNQYHDTLFRFIVYRVHDDDLAQDIVQDTLMKLYTHKHYYRDLAKFSTWIYTIAGNLAKTELRRKKRHKVTNLSHMSRDEKEYQLPSVEPETDDTVQGHFAEKEIQKAIQELPLHFRTVVIMRDIQELSYEEISNILNVPLGTVKSRINRGRLELQGELKDLR